MPEKLKKCPVCKNQYDLNALCFDDDPEQRECNGCFLRSKLCNCGGEIVKKIAGDETYFVCVDCGKTKV